MVEKENSMENFLGFVVSYWQWCNINTIFTKELSVSLTFSGFCCRALLSTALEKRFMRNAKKNSFLWKNHKQKNWENRFFQTKSKAVWYCTFFLPAISTFMLYLHKVAKVFQSHSWSSIDIPLWRLLFLGIAHITHTSAFSYAKN